MMDEKLLFCSRNNGYNDDNNANDDGDTVAVARYYRRAKEKRIPNPKGFFMILRFFSYFFFSQKIRNIFWFFLGYCRKPVKAADLLPYFIRVT